MLHVLPKGFHRIRHYGLLARSRTKADTLVRARDLIAAAQPETLLPTRAEAKAGAKAAAATTEAKPAHPCPCCGGLMVIIETFDAGTTPRNRPSAPTTAIRIDTSRARRTARCKAARQWRWWSAGSEEFSLDNVLSPPAFVDAQAAEAALAERRALARIGDATSVLGDVVLRYASAHPKSAQVPEALYLLVRATRYGTPNSAMSKRAFGMLHGRYANSVWTRLTPYFY